MSKQAEIWGSIAIVAASIAIALVAAALLIAGFPMKWPDTITHDLINSFTDLLWLLTAIIVLMLLWPTVRSLIKSRKFKIKLGDFEISFDDFVAAKKKESVDIYKKLAELEQRLEMIASQRTTVTPPLKRLLWVAPKAEEYALDMARLGPDVTVVTVPTVADAAGVLGAHKQGAFDAVVGVGSTVVSQLQPQLSSLKTTLIGYTPGEDPDTLDSRGVESTSSSVDLYRRIKGSGSPSHPVTPA